MKFKLYRKRIEDVAPPWSYIGHWPPNASHVIILTAEVEGEHYSTDPCYLFPHQLRFWYKHMKNDIIRLHKKNKL